MTPVSTTQTSAPPASQIVQPQGAMAALDTTAFLKLLIAELQFQDPTKPMDTSQMVQQLSSFAQIEQAAATNVKLSGLLDAMAVGQGASLIGRTIISADGSEGGQITSIRLSENGFVAQLADGKTVAIGQGVTVR